MSYSKFTSYKCGKFNFICRGWSTGRGWGHEAYLLIDGYGEVARYKTRYYNRTWEAYQYQSVMYGAVEDYYAKELAHFLRAKKIELGLIRWENGEIEEPWRRGQKKQYIEEFEASDTGKDIKVMNRFIKERGEF